MNRIGGAVRTGLVGPLLALALLGCSATFENHGYVPPPDVLAEVQIGDSRAEVSETAGTPGVAGVMREEAWFYTAYRMRNYAYRAPEVTERQVLAISFDGRGRVANIEEFGLEDGRMVQLSRRVTTSSVRDIGFLRQILSNFGRINLGETLGGD
jgi:outer membrane protein assembly factor BamE (lipoprotein component of BamABCDE complex)